MEFNVFGDIVFYKIENFGNSLNLSHSIKFLILSADDVAKYAIPICLNLLF